MDNREDTIKKLYSALTLNSLPDNKVEDKDYYFEEATGSYYKLTGKTTIERPVIDSAKKYFEDILRPMSNLTPDNPQFQKALYIAIAIESINRMLNNKK